MESRFKFRGIDAKSLVTAKVYGMVEGEVGEDTLSVAWDKVREKLYQLGASSPEISCYITYQAKTPQGEFALFECYATFSMDTYIESEFGKD